jgi:hypothetical protein
MHTVTADTHVPAADTRILSAETHADIYPRGSCCRRHPRRCREHASRSKLLSRTHTSLSRTCISLLRARRAVTNTHANVADKHPVWESLSPILASSKLCRRHASVCYRGQTSSLGFVTNRKLTRSFMSRTRMLMSLTNLQLGSHCRRYWPVRSSVVDTHWFVIADKPPVWALSPAGKGFMSPIGNPPEASVADAHRGLLSPTRALLSPTQSSPECLM